MTKSLAALLYLVLATTAAAAQPVTGSGAEIAWTAPQEGAVLEVPAGTETSDKIYYDALHAHPHTACGPNPNGYRLR